MIKQYKNHKSILVIMSNAVSDMRMDFAAYELREAGYEVDIIREVPYHKASQYDLFICCRPGESMTKFLNVVLDAGKPLIVDFDDDFNAVPKHSPAYGMMGPGNPNFLHELDKLIHRERVLLTFSTEELSRRYHADGIIMPNVWDDNNKNWALPKYKRKTTNIGFSGTFTHREDFNLCEHALKDILRDYPQTKLVVNVDDQIYSRFGNIPEGRKLFLPGVRYDLYPLIYRYVDILVVPLRDTHFNRAKSDIKMIECGASHTFYVASDLPFYVEWGVGGYIAPNCPTPDETSAGWYDALKRAIEEPAECLALAEIGHAKAMTRTAKLYGMKWVAVVDELLGTKRSES